MRCSFRVAALVAVCVWLFAAGARAQGASVDRLIDTLKNGADFRVRTQAALALGASKNPAAVGALCSGLGDPNTTVRAAAALALGKLALGGSECLTARLSSEPSETVKSVIQKALELIQGGGAEPAISASTKFYVQLGKVSDKSGRTDASVDRLFRQAFAAEANAVGGVVIAPPAETPDKAKQRLAAFKSVKGFYLAPSVPAFDYSGGKLTVKVAIAVFSYPAKVMLGSFTRSASIEGVSPGDKASEDELIAHVGKSSMKILAERSAQFQ